MGLYYKGTNENGVNIFAKSRYLKEAERICKDPKKYILQGLDDDGRAEIADHNKLHCGFNGRRVEKRLCRCLVNYGKDFDCDNCCIKAKHGYAKKTISKNGEPIEMIDFEIAVSEVDTPIGAIDLIFSLGNEKYIAEFKPKWNKETLLRMIAEIETYSYVASAKGHFMGYKKAIVFMDNSEQYGQFYGYYVDENGIKKEYKYKANQAILDILDKLRISVFCLYDDKSEGAYVLEKVR